MDLTKEALQFLLDRTTEPVLPVSGNDPFAIVPSASKVEDLAKFFPPQRITSKVQLTTPASFVEYVNRFKDRHSLIFAAVSDTSGSFEALLDYHTAGQLAEEPEDVAERAIDVAAQPRRCEHRARYTVEETTEWRRWLEANRKEFSQEEFAIWLEENQDLMAEPKGADLLELVTTLEAKNHVRFSSSMRLSSGKNALAYDEDVELKGATTTQSGKIEVPRIIEAGISPFHGVVKYRVKARLKYRIESRAIKFWFETISPHNVIRDALQGICEIIKLETKCPLLLGKV